MNEAAAEKLAWLRKEIVGKEIFMACDKGHKKGLGNFVKFISYWDPQANKVQV